MTDDRILMNPLLKAVRTELAVVRAPFDAAARRSGLVVADVVNGFATVGAGALAPPAPDHQVERMVVETGRLARLFAKRGAPILAFLDTHEPGKPEPPYPPHCERGTGEEDLIPALAWLAACPEATLIRKDCINPFIGAIDLESGTNRLLEWVNANRLEAVVAVGICTDICVTDLVLTLLSARNHGMMPTLRDVVVYDAGCATYDLPRDIALKRGLPATAAHPQALTHHVGLYVMAARGAGLASEVR